MLKAALTVYLAGLAVTFGASTLYFAFQIFRPGAGDIWRGDPEGPPPSKGAVWAFKIFFFLFLIVLTFLVAAIWPLIPLIAVGVVLYQRAAEKRQEGENDVYRR